MVKVINFMLCAFYHNLKEKNGASKSHYRGNPVHFLCGLRRSLCCRVGRGKQCVVTIRSRIRSLRSVPCSK